MCKRIHRTLHVQKKKVFTIGRNHKRKEADNIKTFRQLLFWPISVARVRCIRQTHCMHACRQSASLQITTTELNSLRNTSERKKRHHFWKPVGYVHSLTNTENCSGNNGIFNKLVWVVCLIWRSFYNSRAFTVSFLLEGTLLRETSLTRPTSTLSSHPSNFRL